MKDISMPLGNGTYGLHSLIILIKFVMYTKVSRAKLAWVTLITIVVAAVFLFNIHNAFAAGNTWYVNASATGNGSGTSAKNATTTIQAAIDAASPGDTIQVASGVYLAFEINAKAGLTINGATSTIIKPATLIDTGAAHKYTADMKVSAFVNASAGVTLKNLTIEGNGNAAPGNGGPDALLFWNASSGTVNNVVIQGTYTINGDQTGQGIAVDAGLGQTTSLTVTNSSVNGFQKNGIDIEDGNSKTSGNAGTIAVDVENSTITGAGPTGQIAQNGIVAWNEGGGAVSLKAKGNTFSNLDYTGSSDTAAAILGYGGAVITPVSNNTFTNTQIYIESGSSGTAVDATSGNIFDGVSPTTASSGAQLATIENKLYGFMEDQAVDPIFILPKTYIVTISSGNRGIQAGLNGAASGDSVLVTPGTYSGDVTPPASNNVTLEGYGNPVLDLASGYGINLDNNVTVTNFAFNGFTVDASSATTYAFKAYRANGLTLNNDIFNGGAGNTGGGIDVNTTRNVTFNNVASTGFHKNGFAVTSAYTAADQASASKNITFNNVTSTDNGWAGIAFYTVGADNSTGKTPSIGGSHGISGVNFTGTNMISNDGNGGPTQGGIFIEGDSDANAGADNKPANKVTTDGTTLDLSHVAFAGNSAFDIINYQTAPVNAIGATFDPGSITGDQMSANQRTAEDAKIYDQLDHSNLGLVTYYSPMVTVTIDKFIDGKAASTTGATASFPMQSSWNTTNIGSGSGAYALSMTGYNSPNAYEAVTSPMSAGADYATNETTGGSVVGADCTTGQPFQLAGYTSAGTFAQAAAAAPSLISPSFSGLQDSEFVIVWNKYCVPAPVNQTPSASTTITSTNATQATWTSVTDPAGSIVYFYESSNSSATNRDGSFTTPVFQSRALNTNSIPTLNTPEGTYYWHVRAEDADGNYSAWSVPTEITIDNSPSVTTVGASAVDTADATLNGTDGAIDADNTSYWWGTTPPTGPITLGTNPGATELPTGWQHDNGLGNVSANGSFNEPLSSLTPGTTYYFVAWIESNGTWYPGAVMSFTTNGAAPTASVTTQAATSISQVLATLNGQNGGLPADNTSFWWGTTTIGALMPGANPGATEFPASGWQHDSGLGSTSVNGTFNEPLTGLASNTEYWFVAWIESNGTWYPGNVLNFTTQSDQPGVTTGAATGLSDADATMNATNGPVDAQGESFWVSTSTINTTSSNIPPNVYSTPVLNPVAANGTFSDQLSLVTTQGIITGGASQNMPAIMPDTTYYYVAWVEVNGNWYPGTVETVTTSQLPTAPGVTTDVATSIADNDATLNGTNGGVDADAESFWVSTSSIDTTDPNAIPAGVYSTPVLNPVSAGSAFADQLSLVTTKGITANGPENMMPITPSTTYNYVAWSHVNGQWYAGSEQQVTTSATPALPAPVANDQTVTAGENQPLTINLLATGSGTIDYSVIQQPTNGTITGTNGNLTYTPDSGYTGSDSFTFVANNGTESNTATVSITVQAPPVVTANPSNPAYVAVGATYSDLGAVSTPSFTIYNTVDGSATSTNPISIDTSTSSTHTIVYSATDGFGNTGYATRIVDVLAAPTVVLTSTSATNTTISDNPIAITATFSEPVQSFDETDISTGNVSSVTDFQMNGDDTVATFDVVPSGNGTVVVSIAPNKFQNLAGSYNADNEQLTFNYATAPAPQFQSFVSSGNGPISGSLGLPSGLVLGASTSTVPNSDSSTSTKPNTSVLSCSTPLITEYMRMGKKNDPAQVKLLQSFLNSNLSLNLPVSGLFSSLTEKAVEAFQLKYASTILAPWGLTQPTGFVYKTTEWQINELNCSTLNAPFPAI